MPCSPIPAVPMPSLPGPLTLGVPSLPSAPPAAVPGGLLPCCSISIPTPDLPYPLNAQPTLPPIIAAVTGVEVVLNAAVSEINVFLQSLTPPCPTE